jgi:hypothetical protein
MFDKHEKIVIAAMTLAAFSLVALSFGVTDAILDKYHGKQQQSQYIKCIEENRWQVYTDTQAENLDFVCRTLTGYRGE